MTQLPPSPPTDDGAVVMDRQPHQYNQPQRLVIFIGPSKSASSSVEQFFMRHASNDKPNQKILPTFENWTYPLFQSKRTERHGSDNGLSALRFSATRAQVLEQVRDHLIDTLSTTTTTATTTTATREESNHTLTKKKRWSHKKNETSLFVASEYLVSFDTNHIIEYLVNVTRPLMNQHKSRSSGASITINNNNNMTNNEKIPPTFEIVINYRTPRIDQWLSIWEQSTLTGHGKAQGGLDFREWICLDNNVMLSKKLAKHSHPLGLAHKLFHMYDTTTTTTTSDGNDDDNDDKDQHQDNKPLYFDFESSLLIHLIDMGGVAKAGLDVSHVIACGVLRVPCVPTNNHTGPTDQTTSSTTGAGLWVQGLERHIVRTNKRKGREPNLTPQQLDAMEVLFRQRDCSYQATLQKLQDEGKLLILHPDSLWRDCPVGPSSSSTVQHQQHSERQEQTKKKKNPYHEFQNVTYMMDALRRIAQCRPRGKNKPPSKRRGKNKRRGGMGMGVLGSNTTTTTTTKSGDMALVAGPVSKRNGTVPSFPATTVLVAATTTATKVPFLDPHSSWTAPEIVSLPPKSSVATTSTSTATPAYTPPKRLGPIRNTTTAFEVPIHLDYHHTTREQIRQILEDANPHAYYLHVLSWCVVLVLIVGVSWRGSRQRTHRRAR
jgi:hypothetical protein